MSNLKDLDEVIRVLVVDDDRGMRFVASQSLEVAGFVVEQAENGAEALEAIRCQPPDIILMDVDMPDVDGYTACLRLREIPSGKTVPVLMMTGLEDVESVRRAYEVGATDYLVKPPNWLILGHRVKYIVRSSRAAEELRKSETRLANAQRIADIGWWEWDVGTNEFFCSKEVRRIVGLDSEQRLTTLQAFLDCVREEDRAEVGRSMQESLENVGSYNLDFRIVPRDGADRTVNLQVQGTRSDTSRPHRIFGTIQDVTERKQREEQIRYLAYFDGLTALPNRSLFNDRVAVALETAGRRGDLAALLFLDLDRFKRINDTLGHEAGDSLLQQAARRVSNCLRSSDSVSRGRQESSPMVARLGGDEFVILLPEIKQVENAATVARRVIDSLARPVSLDSHEVFVTASVGIAIYPLDAQNPEELLKNADAAMYHSKQKRPNSFQFYNASMNAKACQRLELETSLQRALERGELIVHFQPQISVSSGRIVGAEALVRWKHPDMGLVPPGDFIPMAEESGLIVPIGEWVLGEACAQIKALHDAGYRDLRVAVNVSGRQFAESEFGRTVQRVLVDTNLEGRFLELELTETVVMEDVERSRKNLHLAKELGARLSIDDFGTGYSSLGQLNRLPLDVLKVDRSFISGIPHDHNLVALSSAIIAMAQSLGLEVVAEGIETSEQLDFLRSKGCEYMQGFLFSPPIEADGLRRLLEQEEQVRGVDPARQPGNDPVSQAERFGR